jgi:hypothetical protein
LTHVTSESSDPPATVVCRDHEAVGIGVHPRMRRIAEHAVSEIGDIAVARSGERQREGRVVVPDGRLVGHRAGDAVTFPDLMHDQRRGRSAIDPEVMDQ